MQAALDILRDASLEPWQKRQRLASIQESALPCPSAGSRAGELLESGVLCDLHEGHAPYRPRYVLPDYAQFLSQGSEYLDLAPPRDLFEALNALQIIYRYVPSITGYPVYLGQIDNLLEPFWDGVEETTALRMLEMFLIQIDRTLPDAFVHMNLGPRDSRTGRALLRLERRLGHAVPNLSLKVGPETPASLILEAVETALITGKPYFVNDPELAREFQGPYGIASCYNTLPIGGGSHTLVRLNLAKLAKDSSGRDEFLECRLPEAIRAQGELIAARTRFLVEEARFYESSFLAREGLLHLEKFTSMAGIFGLFECVEHLGGGRMGWDAEAVALAERIIHTAHDLVKAQPALHCLGTGGRLGFHAQSGIADDVDTTAGTRFRVGDEPPLLEQIRLQARLQEAFDTGVSEIVLFEPTARQNPEAVLRIVQGALKTGLRILAVGSSDSELVRVSGYLVKRRDLVRIRQGDPLREESARLGEASLRLGHLERRTARSSAGQ